MLVIKILNDKTGNQVTGNYKYEVMATQIEDGLTVPKMVKIAEGEVAGHVRLNGWQDLLKKVADHALKVREKDKIDFFRRLFNQKEK